MNGWGFRRGQQTDLRRTAIFSHMRDERRLDAVEKIIPLADEAGLPMTHFAMAFALAHPGVTSALIVLAEAEALGLELIEVRRLPPDEPPESPS